MVVGSRCYSLVRHNSPVGKRRRYFLGGRCGTNGGKTRGADETTNGDLLSQKRTAAIARRVLTKGKLAGD